MRILHTADWHLGQELFNQDRTEEFQDFLRQLKEITQREQPDVMVVCGDVYNSSVPTTAIQRLYTDAMLSIHDSCPDMEIVVTAGNHDSASKLEIDSNLWQHFRVHVIGSLCRNDDRTINMDAHIIKIKDKGWVVAMPYVYKQNFPVVSDEADRQAAFFRSLLDRVKEKNQQELPVVLTAHMAVCCQDAKCDLTGHRVSTDDELGGIQYVDVSAFGTGYDYLALGHIHHQQGVPSGNNKVRYAGSPLAVSFDESYRHYVSLVDIQHGEEPAIKSIEILPLRPLITIPGEPVALPEALKVLRELPDDNQSYVRLWVKSATGLPADCNEQAQRATEGKQCRFCLFKLKDERQQDRQHQVLEVTTDQLQEMTPVDVACRYLADKGLPTDGVSEMINDIMREIEEEEAR